MDSEDNWKISMVLYRPSSDELLNWSITMIVDVTKLSIMTLTMIFGICAGSNRDQRRERGCIVFTAVKHFIFAVSNFCG